MAMGAALGQAQVRDPLAGQTDRPTAVARGLAALARFRAALVRFLMALAQAPRTGHQQAA
jgi:hypothetical protein